VRTLAPSFIAGLLGCAAPTEAVAAPVAAPDGMIAVAAGSFERHGARVEVAAFFLDRAPVTVEAFDRHVASAGIRTVASREGGGVLSLERGTFSIAAGADHRTPLGDGVVALPDHPATQITAAEAEGYCASRDARLPTSDEWEHAARNGRGDAARYPWGDEAVDAHGAWRANAWQGAFPTLNTLGDGYLFASPVGSFPATPLGFVDLVGNVWHWTATPWDGRGATSPALPEVAAGARVLRGGSFLCDPRVCHGFQIAAAQPGDPGAPLMHVGFRCARDA
jgi:formylglycine-generating enzyme